MPTFTSNNTTPAVVAENTMVSTTISPGEGIKATSAGDAILAEGGVGLRAKTRKASGVAIIADAEGPNQALIAESVGGQAAFFSSRSSTSPTVEIMSSADVALQVTGFASKAGVFGGDVDVAGNLNAGSLNVTRNTNLNGDVGVTGSLNVGRNINVNGDVILSGADCAEEFDTAEATETKPGTVMVLNQDGRLHHCQRAYDKRVAGVISGAGDYRPGLILDRQHSRDNRLPVALVGKKVHPD
jgi:hypothetical protein